MSIQCLEACYRLPPSAAGNRHRLDAALDLLLDGLLDAELARLDLPTDGVLCLRAVYVPVRLELSETVLGMAEAWAKAFAANVAEAVRGWQTANAVRYRSRRELLLDLAIGIATGERQREWAWRQVLEYRGAGPLSEAEAARLWIAALIVEPASIVPVLVVLAEADVLERLLQRLAAEQWLALADALSVRFAVNAEGETRPYIVNRDAETAALPLVESEVNRVVARIAARIAERSVLLRIDLRSQAVEAVAALCRLALVEVEPALAAGASTPLQSVVKEVFTLVMAKRGEPRPAKTSASMLAKIANDAAQTESEFSSIPIPRLQTWTEFGGLLFLLGAMDELAFPARLVERVRETGRSVRFLVHQLALKLVAADADDAAALAFAGLMPNAVPPSVNEESPTADEEAFLNQLREKLEFAVAERLGDVPEASGDPLGFVCRRRAEIVAERGWFELRFAPELVSTAIRKAALDLDPGFVPWLGVVVKFVYG